MLHLVYVLMTEKCSENSACTNHLGTCVISDPDDIAIFEKNMRNPKWDKETKEFYKKARELAERNFE